ncbi:hypothetical protein, partial [Anaerosporobacter sp.]|uniref:hypothetical protein n=1 Tax=Anaerosporobacter sp. TaxID=1872529 RepID=UPI00286FAC43
MDNGMKNIVEQLKALINKNGPAYLSEEPYLTYKELTSLEWVDAKTAGAIMLTLVRGIESDIKNYDNSEEASKLLQKECCFNKRMAGRIAEIFLALYSKENDDEWKAKDLEGWTQFKKTKVGCTWEGFSVWQTSGGSIDCHYMAQITLKPARSIKADKDLARRLSGNPFTTLEIITEYYENKLGKYLDGEFEEYCTCDDYYQPVVEDFEIDY